MQVYNGIKKRGESGNEEDGSCGKPEYGLCGGDAVYAQTGRDNRREGCFPGSRGKMIGNSQKTNCIFLRLIFWLFLYIINVRNERGKGSKMYA